MADIPVAMEEPGAPSRISIGFTPLGLDSGGWIAPHPKASPGKAGRGTPVQEACSGFDSRMALPFARSGYNPA